MTIYTQNQVTEISKPPQIQNSTPESIKEEKINHLFKESLLLPFQPIKKSFKKVSNFLLRNIMLAPFKGIDPNSQKIALNNNNCEYQYESVKKNGVELGHFKSKINLSETQRPTVIFCRGSDPISFANPFADNYPSVYQYYTDRGIDVITFDYIGTGNNEGDASEEGVYLTAEAAYQYATQDCQIDNDLILFHGYSLGSAAGAKLAAEHKTHLILDRPFSKASLIADKIASELKFNIGKKSISLGKMLFPLRWLLKGMMRSAWHLSTEKHIKKMEKSWICLTGSDDKQMDDRNLHHSERIYNQFAKAQGFQNEEIEKRKNEFLVTVEGVGHFTSLTDLGLMSNLDNFLNKIHWLK